MLILPALETFQDASQMGFRSLLVLMKLGFEMREHYDEVLNEAIPAPLGVMAAGRAKERAAKPGCPRAGAHEKAPPVCRTGLSQRKRPVGQRCFRTESICYPDHRSSAASAAALILVAGPSPLRARHRTRFTALIALTGISSFCCRWRTVPGTRWSSCSSKFGAILTVGVR